jgi:adenine-specific DNA-methyltransferase
MIYIDPPYNTGKDFVYKDNFKDNIKNYMEQTGQVDSEGNRLSTNSDTNGRYHSDWLNMMYPRLKLARNLLKDDGVIFISIDDNEVTNLKKLCDEIFGEDNFVSELIWKKKYIGGKHAKHFVDLHEYVLVYSKNIYELEELLMERPSNELAKFVYEDEYTEVRGKHYTRPLKSNLGKRETLIYPIKLPDDTIIETQWMVAEKTFFELVNNGRIVFKKKRDGTYNVYRKYYQKDGGGKVKVPSLIDTVSNADAKVELKNIFNISEGRDIPFENPKPTDLLNYFLIPSTSSEDLILDFFSGSASIAHSIIDLNFEDNENRKYICVQLPEETDKKSEAYKAGYKNICEIGKERIRRAGEKIITDNPDKDLSKLDIGFKVYKLDSSNIKEWDSDTAMIKDIVDYKENYPIDYKKYVAKLRDSGNAFDVDKMTDNEIATKILEYYLESHVDNIKPDRTSEDLLYEILLKYGLDLTLPIEELTIEDKIVYNIGYGALVVCLDDNITIEVVEAIAEFIKEQVVYDEEKKKRHARVVFKDKSFADTNVKTNAIQVLKQFDIDDVVSI